MTPDSKPVIYTVATPIGNLEDISARALRILREVDVIAAEDTRVTQKLLAHFQIQGKQLISYYDHVEVQRAKFLVDKIKSEKLALALVSDAGTPCLSDPGYRLISLARAEHIPVHPVPGPSALTAMIASTGLPSDRVLFVGFLPHKKTELRREIATWSSTRASVVFFESLRRLAGPLALIKDIYPLALVAVGRELTKLHEEIVTDRIDQIIEWLENHRVLKGEVAVMVSLPATEGTEGIDADLSARIRKSARRELKQGLTLKELLLKYKDVGLKRNELYSLLLEVMNRPDGG